MANTPEINAKKAHALEIMYAAEALIDLVESKPELWFGGLPPTYIQLISSLQRSVSNLHDRFELTTILDEET